MTGTARREVDEEVLLTGLPRREDDVLPLPLLFFLLLRVVEVVPAPVVLEPDAIKWRADDTDAALGGPFITGPKTGLVSIRFSIARLLLR